MVSAVRERVKRLPVVGALLYDAYLRMFKNEGEVVAIGSGPLAGRKWVRFMRTYSDEYVAGTYEPPIQQALMQFLRPGMVFYDVGANAGFFTLLAAGLVGPSGKVVAFEAHPKTARQCRAQAAVNELDNVEIVTAAVSDTAGTARFSDGEFSVMTSLKDAETAPQHIVVVTTTLDAAIVTHSAPDVVKIDIEGSEIDALRGAHWLLTLKRPVLLVELHSAEIAAQYAEMMKRYKYRTVSPSGDRFVVSIPGERKWPM